MTFSEIVTESRRISKTNTTSYPTQEITDSTNRALERITALIRDAQGRWQWDDANDTDFAIATTSLVSGQPDYSLDPSHYRIERMEVQDQGGNWTKLVPIDQTDIYNQALTNFLNGNGVPTYYDKVGNSVFLYPKPNYSQDASLKVFYERGPDYFTDSDTTKTPGFNPLFHELLSLWAAYDYAFINQLPIANSLVQYDGDGNIAGGRIGVKEKELATYYGLRDVDDHIRLSTRKTSYK